MCVSKYLMLSFWLVLLIGFATYNGSSYAEEKADIRESEGALSRLEGRICDPSGAPVGWVKVRYFYYSGGKGQEWPFEGSQNQTTNMDGCYRFMVLAGMTYHVEAGGHNATVGVSKRFAAKPGEVHRVEDITVRPARSSVGGVVVDDKGNPVPDLEFVAYSRSRQPTHYESNPYTDTKGEFRIDIVLPDEPLGFCVLTAPNKAQIWKKIKPGSLDLRLVLDPAKEVELPPGWRFLGGLRTLLLANTYVEDKGLSFSLQDFEGKTVSLRDSRYMNKVVLVNIWGTWCGGCMREVPHLIDMQKKYAARGLEIVGIAFERDDSVEGWEEFQTLVTKKKINYTILKGGVEKRENVEAVLAGLKEFKGYPTTIFIDRDGRSKHIQVGFVCSTPKQEAWQVRQVEKRIEELLGN